MKKSIVVKKLKPRNFLVPLAQRRKAGSHKKSNKAIRREQNQNVQQHSDNDDK
jgi:hypothetical protein